MWWLVSSCVASTGSMHPASSIHWNLGLQQPTRAQSLCCPEPRLMVSVHLCLSVYLFTYPSTYLPIYLSIYLSIYLPIYPSIYLSIYLSIHLSLYPSLLYPSV